MNAVARHRWIHVAASAREAVAATAPDDDRAIVADWLARDLPLVARAHQPGDPYGLQPAGLALPIAQGRRRVALLVDPRDIARVDEPSPLEDVARILSPVAREIALELAASARSLGFVACTFGSAAWQWRTGETYLHAASDLDTLAAPPNLDALRRWIGCLEAASLRMPMRIDGEVEWRDGTGVNWREVASAARQLLVKSPAGAHLAERTALEAAWT